MYNRARVIASIDPFLAFRWQSLLYYCDKHNETLRLTPNAPEPPGVSTRRLRQTKCKLWTKMHMILEINGVNAEDRQNISSHTSADKAKSAIMALIRPYNLDTTVVQQILQLFQAYRNTRAYLRKEKKQWQDACASVFTVTDAAFVGQGTEGLRGPNRKHLPGA